MVMSNESDDVNHFYVTYTVDLLPITENTLYCTVFYLKKDWREERLICEYVH